MSDKLGAETAAHAPRGQPKKRKKAQQPESDLHAKGPHKPYAMDPLTIFFIRRN
jgi:hypothetical protein